MAEKKKQHFVPKLLLRHFSNEIKKAKINIFNVETEFYRVNCPLDSQAQEDYFYGEDKVIEDALGKIEDSAAPIIAEIIKEKKIPVRNSEKYIILHLFSIILSYRTKNSSEKLNEVVDKTIKELAKYDDRLGALIKDDLSIKLKNAPAQSLSAVAKGVKYANDLELILLINNTKKKFITSDNPCNRYNQYLESRNHPGSHLGLFSKGLQFFFPISPDLMLVYYDKWAYKFGNKKDKEIFLTNENDINQLNLLQLANCHKICIFDDSVSEMYLKNLNSKVNNLRQIDKSKLYESGKRHLDLDGNEHIKFIHQAEDRRLNMKLSFVKEPQGAKSHKLNNLLVQLRNENMRNFKG